MRSDAENYSNSVVHSNVTETFPVDHASPKIPEEMKTPLETKDEANESENSGDENRQSENRSLGIIYYDSFYQFIIRRYATI